MTTPDDKNSDWGFLDTPTDSNSDSSTKSDWSFLGEDTPPKSDNSDILSGLAAGTYHMVNLIENQGNAALYGILNKFTGDPDYQKARDAYSEKYQQTAQDIEKKYPRNVESFSSAKSIGDYIDVTQRDVAEGLPMLLGLTPAALLAPEAGMGAILAAALPDTAIQTLQSDADLKANGVDSLGAAFLMGAAKHGVNYLGKVQALQSFFGNELKDDVSNSLASKIVSGMTGGRLSEASAQRVGNIMTNFAKGGASFAPVGMAQTAIDQAGTALLADNKDFLTKENLASIMEQGVAGFLTGGILGGGHAALRGAKTPETLQEAEQQHTTDTVNKATGPIEDVGSATKYFTDNNLDPTTFSTEEGLIKAANRLKENKVEQKDLSPALSTLHMEPEKQRLLTGPEQPITQIRSAADVETFFKQRAEEMHNQAILAQPEAQSLVSRGLDPKEVVKLPPKKIAELAERITKSYDSISKQELDQHIVDSEGNVMDQKSADYRKSEMDAFKQVARDNKAENYNKLQGMLRQMQQKFLPGDGVVISPTQNDSFLGKMQDAFYADKAKQAGTIEQNTKPAATFAQQGPKAETTGLYGQLKLKAKNHPIPESAPKETVKEPETVATTDQPEVNQLPLVTASKSAPENDSRVIQQDAERTQRNAIDDSKTRFQKLQPLTPEEAQLHRAHNMPTMVFNNMRMTPPSHEFRGAAREAVHNLARIVKEVAGPHAVFRPVEILHSLDPITAEPVNTLRGAQYRNLIFTSMEHLNNPKLPLAENVLHEVWHMLANDTSAFTESDKKLIELEHPKISKYVNDHYALPAEQLSLMSQTPEGRDEINATAFGIYANKLRAGESVENFKSPVKTLFRKALNILSKFGNYLRGAGFRTYEDMFKTVNSGDRQAKAADFHDNAINEIRQVRLQKISEDIQKKHMEEMDSRTAQLKRDMDKAVLESTKYKNDSRLGVPMDSIVATRNRWLRSAIGLAHQYEAWRIPVQMGIDMQNKIRGYGTRYASLHDAATTGYAKPDITRVHNLMDKIGQVGQKANFEYLSNGKPDLTKPMTYTDPDTGKLVISTDFKFNKLYAQTKEQFIQVNDDFENPIRNALENHGIERNIPIKELENIVKIHQNDMNSLNAQEAMIKKQLSDARAAKKTNLVSSLEKERDKLALQKRDKERWLSPVEDALTNLQDIDARRNVDYTPHMRFGPYGISVYAKEDVEAHPDLPGKFRPIKDRKAAYFGTVERAKILEKRIGGDGSLLQHKAHLAEIKKLGFDSDKYVVFGKDKPFFLTQNAIGNQLNSRAVTLDLLYGLMQDKNMEAYSSMMDHIKNATALKGFAKHFSERDNVPGYSKDWDRATPKYLTSAANYIGRRAAAPDLATYRTTVQTSMPDLTMRTDLLKYMDYMEGPAEDYLAFKEMNYIWALGMNPMSAALQAMTLPTSTHMSMNTYSPSPIKNAGYIAKWFGKALALSKQQRLDKDSGMLTNDFASRKSVDALIANKFFDKDPVKNKEFGDFMHKMATEGRLEGFYKNDMTTKAARGHDTFGDKSYHARRKISNIAGIGLGFMETSTRIATVMAHYDMIRSEKGVMDRANRVLQNDKVFQSLLRDTRFTPEQHLALFGMDEAHAVFSKAARGTFQRGIAGVLMPFSQYPVQVTEHMIRQLGRGPEAKMALAMNLGTLMILSGALGLPGANIMKDAAEFAYKQVSGHNVDLEEIVRERLSEAGVSPAMSVMLTQGFSRPVLGIDIGKRIGFGDAIPTADLLLSLFGIRGNSVLDSMGVQGSVIKNAGLAWNDYNNGASATEIAAKITPSAISNMLQGYNYGHTGVKTAKGDMLIPPDQVSTATRFAKALGVTPGTVSDARENMYFTKMKENEWTDFIGHNTKLLSSLRTERIIATKNRDESGAKAALAKEQEVISSLRQWQKDTGYPLNFTNMNSNIRKQVQNNIRGGKQLKDVKKSARKSVSEIKNITNISGDNG